MEAAGFVLVDGGAALEVQPLAAPKAGPGKGQPANAAFKFPALDAETEAFLYRRKADLEAVAADLESDAEAHEGAHQSDAGRARLDASDAQARGHGVSSGKLQPGDAAKSYRLGGAAKAPPAAAKATSALSKRTALKGGKDEPSHALASLQAQVTGFMKGKTEAQIAQLGMLKAAFQSLDVNGDGFIDAADLRAAWRGSGHDASERRAVAWVRARDMNADDKVAFDEFVASFSAQLAPSATTWARPRCRVRWERCDSGRRCPSAWLASRSASTCWRVQ
jgi:hypothetical protein